MTFCTTEYYLRCRSQNYRHSRTVHQPFRPTSVTLKMGKHEAVDLLVHSQDTATPPTTAFVTTPSGFRILPTPESADTEQSRQGQSHRPLCSLSSLFSSHISSHIFALFSYLCFLSMPTLALFPYSIFHSLPIQISVQSESHIDWPTVSPSSLTSCSESSSPFSHPTRVQYIPSTLTASFCPPRTPF